MIVKSEVVAKYNAVQNQLWQTVSSMVSEAVKAPIQFSEPASTIIPISDLFSEMAAPKLVIQFAFAHEPESPHVFVMGEDLVADLYHAVKGERPTSMDESRALELRPTWDALVEAICLAAGQIRGEAVVAADLTIRFQVLNLPPSMQKGDDVFRTIIQYSSDETQGSAMWLVDLAAAHSLANVHDDEDASPLPALRGAGEPSNPGDAALDLLGDIPLDITVELGRLRMLVREVVELGAGSIVEIDKAAGEPVDVLVNGRLVARGEVVVIEDNFGVRITEILTPQERLASLREAA